ncbi:hypothetical protein [Mycoplasmopsis agassizii]|uniref:Lipoprotein n=1 Tax=Mycoplasmopsis agassizii TaxID=33922 RepID=A0ABX4H3X7_9BACT|nr:hypothetical protein [Mycoplasmopsis agassizii]PAF54600.1 hypothetical protein CJF60_05000 [Mycoplasmopsis agassizii]SMC19428.1 hypothetical protein SAMN02745179_00905 [Mycoplasmopsis agassizii]
MFKKILKIGIPTILSISVSSIAISCSGNDKLDQEDQFKTDFENSVNKYNYTFTRYDLEVRKIIASDSNSDLELAFKKSVISSYDTAYTNLNNFLKKYESKIVLPDTYVEKVKKMHSMIKELPLDSNKDATIAYFEKLSPLDDEIVNLSKKITFK